MIRRMLTGKESPLLLEDKLKDVVVDESWPQVLKNCLSRSLAEMDLPLTELEFLAIDFETSGLNAEKDQILSIGMVEFNLEQVDLSSAEEILIDNGEFVKASTAEINGLTPKALAQGVSLEQGIERLLEKAQGKVILAHSCRIEKCFLESFFEKSYQLNVFPFYFVDTIFIEKRFSYAGKTRTHTSYQLNDMRRYYKLPDYIEHSAASDALACAELFIVQTKKLKLNDIKGMCLKKVLS